MAWNRELTKKTVDNLVSNTYLHSNTNNFVEAVTKSLIIKREKDLDNFDNLLKKIQNFIDVSLVDINGMYEELGFKNKDEWTPTTGYQAYGAKEFKDKFLINKTKTNDNSEDSINRYILSQINSKDSLDCIMRIGEEEQKKNIKGINLEDEKEMIEILEKLTGKTMGHLEDTSTRASQFFISKVFTKKAHGKGTMVRLNSDYKNFNENEKQLVKKLLDMLNLDEDLDLNSNKGVKKLKTAIETRLNTKFHYKVIATRYYDDFIVEKIKEYCEKNNIKEVATISFRTDFINLFTETLTNYGSIDFTATSFGTIKGFVLEFGLAGSLNLTGFDKAVKILGQQYEKRKFNILNKEKDEEGQTIKTVGEKYVKTQSASDIVIKGKNKEYRLQLKNSFADGNTLSFRAQPQIKMSTFLLTAFKEEEERNTLKYLLINYGFLKDYGLDAYGNSLPLKQKDVPQIKEYLILLLELAYQFILSTEYDIENKMQQKGNIAYIYKGEYLIPVAMYFASAYELLLKLKINGDYRKNSSFGGLSLPTFSEAENVVYKENDNIVDNIKFQTKKHELINKLMERLPEGQKYEGNRDYKYPQDLLNIGKIGGESIYEKMSFRLHITMYLDKLEDLLNKEKKL